MTPLRLLHLTDLHLTDGPRLSDQAAVLQHIAAEAPRLGVQATIITGDIYGMTVPHRSTPAERAVLFPVVASLATLGPVVVVYGNHDHIGDLETLEQIGGTFDWPVHVVSVAKRLQLRTPGPDMDVYCLPWITKRWLLAGENAPRGAEDTRILAGQKIGELLKLWAAQRRARAGQAVAVFASHCMIAGAKTSGGERLHGTDIEVPLQGIRELAPDVGLLGHIHKTQMVTERCGYGGDPYAVDHSETELKTFCIVDIADEMPVDLSGPERTEHVGPGIGGASTHLRLSFMPSHSRRFVTLDWRWAADHEDGAPRWVRRPTDEQIADVKDCEVRARLTVPAQWRAGCPWDAEIQILKDAGAHRIQIEAVTEPVMRIRAPEVAKAKTYREKLVAYWNTLASPPPDVDKASALELLAELETRSDEDIEADTGRMVG